MWKKLWEQLRDSRFSISLDSAHLRDDRNGRYQRGFNALGRILALGEPLGYREFKTVGQYDICYLVVWKKEEYEEAGQYMVFQLYYKKKNSSLREIGYRVFEAAEICTYYDGESPNPGRTMNSREEAIKCMKEKEGYHECK
jgi:hypothetical protein